MQKGKAKRLEVAADLILLDTHIAVWLAEGSTKVEKRRDVLQSAYEAEKLIISAISAWEVGMLVAKNRLILPQSPLAWFDELTANFGITVIDVTAQVAIQSSFLPGAFRGDAADRIIIATAQRHNAILLTADKPIIAYSKTGVIKTMEV